MKFEKAQREKLLRCIPSAYTNLRIVARAAAEARPDQKAQARQRLQEAAEMAARYFDRPLSKIVHAMYGDEKDIAKHIRPPSDKETPADSARRFWDCLSNSL